MSLAADYSSDPGVTAADSPKLRAIFESVRKYWRIIVQACARRWGLPVVYANPRASSRAKSCYCTESRPEKKLGADRELQNRERIVSHSAEMQFLGCRKLRANNSDFCRARKASCGVRERQECPFRGSLAKFTKFTSINIHTCIIHIRLSYFV